MVKKVKGLTEKQREQITEELSNIYDVDAVHKPELIVDKNATELKRKCQGCGKEIKIIVGNSELFDYGCGELNAYDAFPYLDYYEQRFLETGLCKECWKKISKGVLKC